MNAYLQTYQAYDPATAQVKPAAGQQLQAEDTAALDYSWPLVAFASSPYWQYDPRMGKLDPPAVPEPAPFGLLLCAAGLSGLVAFRRHRRTGA
ncbi:MAG TPA: PEP-CTERM sorting domain-containing protein [Bryobacteraceae bacterium]|nr:PEP-CTERM sorting domain-containing protein [Bryobacteraceae bacterium]